MKSCLVFLYTIVAVRITRGSFGHQARNISGPILSKHEGSVMHILTDSLLRNYPPIGGLVRPRRNVSEVVEVNTNFSIERIYTVDEFQQSVEFRMLSTMQWSDDFLIWNPSDFGGIKHVYLPSDSIWIPDIVVFDEISAKCLHSSYAVIYHDGGVLLAPTCVRKILCNVDISHFPFDKHSCSFHFGSWVYETTEIDLKQPPMGRSYMFEECPEWILVDISSEMKPIIFGNGTYLTVQVIFVIRRYAPLFAYLFLLPATLLSAMTSVVFLLPPSNPDKINIGVGILLSFMILLNILMEQTPKSAATVPLIGYYLTLGSLLISMSVFSATILQNVLDRSKRSRKVPESIQRTFPVMGALLCHRYRPNKKIYIGENETRNYQSQLDNNDGRKEPNSMTTLGDTRLTDNKSILDTESNDWDFLACLLDRFFFLVYVVVNVVVSTAIFSQLAV